MAQMIVNTMARRSEIPAFKVWEQRQSKWVDLDRWIEAQKGTLNSSTILNAPKPSEGTTRGRGRRDDH